MLPSNVSEFETAQPPPPPPTRSGGSRFSGGLVLTIVLLVALVGVIAFAVMRLPVGTPARPTPAAVAPPSTQTTLTTAPGSPADAATAQAIQTVVRQLDDAQAQAIATKNPQLMASAATPEFYAEEVATNQDLIDSGVTEVRLLNIEWGDITVNDDRASATAWETWTTTFDDGSTLQARDRNVYTLVKDASGNWRVQADDHPDQQQPQVRGQ